MTKQIVFTDAAAAPGGGYSQAVVSGGLAFIAGCVPHVDADASFADKANDMFDHLAAIAAAAGASLADAVRVGIYLQDLSDFAEMDAIFRARFPTDPPARTTIQCGLRGVPIEVDAVIDVSGS